MEFEGESVNDMGEIANKMNDFFCEMAKNLDYRKLNRKTVQSRNKCVNSIFLSKTSEVILR